MSGRVRACDKEADCRRLYQSVVVHTELLYTHDTDLFATLKKELNLFQSLLIGTGAIRKATNYFDTDNLDKEQKINKLVPIEFIWKSFNFAWDLQADGGQSNATLHPAD